MEEVRKFQGVSDQSVPLYLTLPGAEGTDIDSLVTAGIISLTSVHGIASADIWKIAAVESSPGAILKLQQKFPGLKIIEQPIQSLIRGDSPTKWPDNREHEALCRARVINLDINEPLVATRAGGRIIYPLLERIQKFAMLHTLSTPLDWTLLLTIHGEINWDEATSRSAQEFIGENCSREPAFRSGLVKFWGEDLVESFENIGVKSLSGLSAERQQRFLMAFVPKKIASLVHQQSWRVETLWNYGYGGRQREAPMTTWAMAFFIDERASSKPDALYRESLRTVLRQVGFIQEDGSILG
jgi:hypothetical protein